MQFCLFAVLFVFSSKGSPASLLECISKLKTYGRKILFASQVILEFVKLYMKVSILSHLFISGFSGSSGERMRDKHSPRKPEHIPYDPTRSLYTFVLV